MTNDKSNVTGSVISETFSLFSERECKMICVLLGYLGELKKQRASGKDTIELHWNGGNIVECWNDFKRRLI